MTTLPSATPAAKTMLLTILWPRSALAQASARLSRKWRPGTSGIGTRFTVRMSCVAAIATMAKGASAVSSPRNRTIWLTTSKRGVRSTIGLGSLVVDAALDEAELGHRQHHHQQHQDDALRRRAGIIEPFEAVEVDLVDHQLGGPRRAALGHDVDDAEAVGEAVGHVDDDQEEDGGRQQRQLDVAQPAQQAGAVHRAGLEQRARDRLQRRQEEDEVVADIF